MLRASLSTAQAVREAGWQGDWAGRQPEEEYLEWVVQIAEEQARLPVEVLFEYLADVLLQLHEEQARRGEVSTGPSKAATARISTSMCSAGHAMQAAPGSGSATHAVPWPQSLQSMQVLDVRQGRCTGAVPCRLVVEPCAANALRREAGGADQEGEAQGEGLWGSRSRAGRQVAEAQARRQGRGCSSAQGARSGTAATSVACWAGCSHRSGCIGTQGPWP
jgi:hypothetical protein